MNTAATSVGETNLIKNLQVLKIFRCTPESSSIANLELKNHPAKIATSMPPRGIKISKVKKTIESIKVFLPIKFISFQILKLKTLPMPTTHMIKPRITAAVRRETILFSSKYATLGSSKEIALLSAAIDNSVKNAGPIKLPTKPISLKIDSRLIKTRPWSLCRIHVVGKNHWENSQSCQYSN